MVASTIASALDRFLGRPQFSLRTRESYDQDLALIRRRIGDQPVAALTPEIAADYLAAQAHLAPSTYNRRFAALRSFIGWCMKQGWLVSNPLAQQERLPERRLPPRALNPADVHATLHSIRDRRDRALFWLIYEGGLRCREALAIDIEDINWTERGIVIRGKGQYRREVFFSKQISRYLDAYLGERGNPTTGPLFVTHRRAKNPRRTDVTPDGFARLSYRQADTLWKHYTPDWDVHQLRHTAITARAARGYTEVELKQFSGHQSLRSLEIYIAENREAAKRKAREWERNQE
ncbi:MAG: tyrosine-type recombinase/integrase [Ktedonobacterales bacterium]|nr:tyrosine-type recombinase/integrase [Ktedonobacterales bacterium]